MSVFTIAPSPFNDDPGCFFILRLGTIKVFKCTRGHSYPLTHKYAYYRTGKGDQLERWTLSIWGGAVFEPLSLEEQKELAAAWRWYKRQRKQRMESMLGGFSLS